MRRETLRLGAALMALAVGLTASPGRSGSVVLARARTPPASLPLAAAYDCEGDACSQVTITFDETKQQYLARNNSTDHWAKVSASNLSSFASVCVGPGKSDYLKLKSMVGPYRAEFADGCGASALGG